MRLLKERPVARRRDINLEEPPNRWQLFVTWLLDSLTPGVPVVSTVGAGSLKSPASIWRGVVFVLIVGMMAMGRVALAEEVGFNVTVKLSYNDYKRTTYFHEVRAHEDNPWSCGEGRAKKQSTHIIPFKQEVVLEPDSRELCTAKETSYRKNGGNWIPFTTQQKLLYEGNLGLHIYGKSTGGFWDCHSWCIVTLKAKFFDKTPTTSQQKNYGPYPTSLPVVRGKQELRRIPVPTSQFPTENQVVNGMVRDLACQVTTDKSSDVKLWCEREGNEYVVYAYAIQAINGPLAPLASIDLVKSSGVKYGVIKVVKWKDDAFQKGHDLIEFIGQAIDIDGTITEYRWESDKDGIIGNQRSFFYTDLSLGQHTITFKAKDNDGLWSNVITQKMDVVKPPLLLVHSYRGDKTTWDKSKDFLAGYYPIETVTLGPKDHTSISQGADVLSGTIKKLTAKYGVPKVNLLAHSWGGLTSRWYIQNRGYRSDVNKLVMLGTPNHGSTMATLLSNSLKQPGEMGVHYTIPIGAAIIASSILGPTEVFNQWQKFDKDDNSGGEYSYELIPGSSALRNLNGNKKDEGYVGHEPNDNISTMYGNNVQYFNVGATGLISLTHWHFEVPFTDIRIYEIVIPTISFDTDVIVSKQSANLDNVPMKMFQNDWTANLLLAIGAGVGVAGGIAKDELNKVGNKVGGDVSKTVGDSVSNVADDLVGKTIGDKVGDEVGNKAGNAAGDIIKDFGNSVGDAFNWVAEALIDATKWHENLPDKKATLEPALYFLGDDPPEAPENADEGVDVSKALAAHVIFAPEDGKFSTLPAGETKQQQFDIDGGTKNLVVMFNLSTEGEPQPFSFHLLSPSGVTIDEDTELENVAYRNGHPVSYVIANAEAGTWTAIIESKGSESIDYALGILGETSFWVGMVEGQPVEPGEPFNITAYAQKDGTPLSGLNVKATLIKTLDEGERIGSKYGSEMRDVEPVEVALNDLGDGRYEVVYEDTLASGVYRVFITATDPATDTSREVFSTFFVEYEYELAIQDADISFSNETPNHNETITISANVHNDTGIDAKGVEVWVTDGSLGENGTVIGKTTIDITANGNTTASTSWEASAGEHDIFVIVSPMNTFIEKNVANNTASKTIQVVDNPPVAKTGPDQIARFNTNIFLDGTGSTDEIKIERYEWDINIRSDSNGDGIADNDVDLTGVLPFIPAGTYSTVGDYGVKLTVFDPAGQSGSDTLTIKVQGEYDFEPPIAKAEPDKVVNSGEPVRFDGSGSTDNYGIATSVWDINTNVDSNGDGSKDNDVDLMGIQPILTSGYALNGVYRVKLTVTDISGHTSSDTMVIGVGGLDNIGTYSTKGHIKDEQGEPIESVTVNLNNRAAVTNKDGNWEIHNLAAIEYTLTASKEGYSFESQDNFAVGEKTQVNNQEVKATSLLQVKVIANERQGVKQSETITYTITVTNNGDKTATGVVLTDTLPTAISLISIETSGGGSCDADTVTCTLPNLTPRATAQAQVVVSNTQMERLENKVIVTSNEYPADVHITWTEVKPYLSVSISDIPDPVTSGGVLHYTADVELSHSAPTPATGINLVMRLPTGVELESVNTDYGICDVSDVPTIICEITDLSIDSTDAISHITVNIDVVLKDFGLLLLTYEAKVAANEYPAHSVRERTEIDIPPDIEVDIAFVIDETGSMQGEINGVIRALKQFIAEIEPSTAPLIALITFKDDVKIKAFTRDMNVLLSAVEKLKAAGGGTCPEAAAEALHIAIPHTKQNGNIMFATDASPYADADIEGITTLIRSKGIRFNAIITDDCTNPDSWNKLPNAE